MSAERWNAGNQPASPQTTAGRALPPQTTANVPCEHRDIATFSGVGGRLWACAACSLRFYPACQTCVVNGHRNGVHPEEAADAALAGLAEKVRGMPRLDNGYHPFLAQGFDRGVEAAAALIEGAHSVERAAEGEPK